MKKWSFPVSELVERAPQLGRVEGVALRPRRREPLVPVQSWDLAARRIDHGRPGKREVTLIQAEHVVVVGRLLGRPVDYLILRRNVLVSGVNLLSLLGRRFSVGGAVLEATGVCDPCERMEEVLGEGGHAAMIGHGGICAQVIEPGVIAVGDTLRPAWR